MRTVATSGGWHEDGRIRVLGDVTITAAGRTRRLELTTNGGLVLALLVARRNERVGIDELIEVLWPGQPPPTARKGVHVAVLRLRDLLDPDRTQREAGGSPIVGHPDAYELVAAPDRIDAAAFEAVVRAGQRALTDGDPAAAARHFGEATGLWGDPFGGGDSGVPAGAVAAYADHLRTTHRMAATGRLEAEVRLGTEDVAALEQAVAADPYDERRWGLLMIGLFRQGRQAAALETFQRARRLLVDELGLEPGPYLRRVEEQVLLQDGPLLTPHDGARSRAPAVSWPGPPPLAGPVLLREDDQRSVERHLERWRVVTLVGPPGVGKTTLATALAGTRLRDAVAWASLGAVPPGPGAAVDVAMRLGVASEASSDADEFARLLAQRIGDRPLLVVLDNAEHLVDAVAPLVDTLTRSCPNLHVLVTSRRPLGARFEQVVRLHPFRTRAEADDDSATSPAVAYLTERAALDRPSARDLAALARVADHVGGLALGLEHAAARLRELSPEELARRLEVLDDPEADGLGRAIDWSLSLLGEDEQTMLAVLAHLEADWDLSRAEAVGARRGLRPAAVTGAVASLLGHSLITMVTGDAGADRRRIIEPVRLHVRARAAATGDGARHAAACAATIADEVTAAAALLEGRDQATGIATMTALMPDVRRAIVGAVERGDAAVVARLLARLRSWWWISGLYADGQMLYGLADPLLRAWRPTDPLDTHERLRALAAGVTVRPGFAAPAVRADDLHRYLAEAEAMGAPPDVTGWIAQMLSSGLSFINRDPARSTALARRAIDDADRCGDGWLRAWGLYALAIATRTDPAAALSYLEQSAFGFAEHGDRLHAARVLMFLGHGARIFGDPRNSADAFAQAETWCRELGAAPVTQLDCELGRACSAEIAGDDETAAAMYRSLVPRLWTLGDYRCAAVAQRNLGAVLLRSGDADGARALVQRSIEILRGLTGEESDLAAAQILRGEIAVADRQYELAARILGRAETLAAAGGGVPMELRDYDRLGRLREVITAELGGATTDVLAAAGATDDVL